MSQQGIREELKQLKQALINTLKYCPKQALAYQSSCQEVISAIDQHTSAWSRVWSRNHSLEDLHHQAIALKALVDPLSDLVNESERVKEQVQALRAALGELVKNSASIYLLRQCDGWLGQLTNIAQQLTDQQSIDQCQQLLIQLAKHINTHQDGVRFLKEADELINKPQLTHHSTVMAFRQTLNQIENNITEHGITSTVVHQLDSELAKLRSLGSEYNEALPELQTISAVLRDLRGWSRSVNAHHLEVQQLERKRAVLDEQRKLGQEVNTQDVLVDAQRLREHLIGKAREFRREQLQKLSERINYLTLFYHDPELDKKIKVLKTLLVDRPRTHEQWLEQFDQTNSYFQAIATSHKPAIQTQLDQSQEKLSVRINAIKQTIHSVNGQQQLHQINHSLNDLKQFIQAEQLLDGLSILKQLDESLIGVEQAERDRSQSLIKKWHQLADLSKELQEEIATVSEVAQFSKSLSEDYSSQLTQDINQWLAENDTLDQAEKKLQEIQHAIRDLKQHFYSWCDEVFSERYYDLEAHNDLLVQLGNNDHDLSQLDAIDSQSHRLSLVKSWQDTLNQALQTAWDQCESNRKLLINELDECEKRRPLDSLEQQKLGNLQQELTDQVWLKKDSLYLRLGLLHRSLLHGRVFLDRISYEEKEVIQLKGQLKGRVKHLKDHDLLHPSLEYHTQSLIGLIDGVPDSHERLGRYLKQLKKAQSMLGALEQSALRMAAKQTNEALMAIKQQAANDPMTKRLIERIEKHDSRQMLGVLLRLQLQDALNLNETRYG